MIVQERITCNNGVEQMKTYSDEGYYIKQIETNVLYVEAYDNIPVAYTYEETDELIND